MAGRYTRGRTQGLGSGHDSPMPEEIRLPGLTVIEHTFEVPLDHDDDSDAGESPCSPASSPTPTGATARSSCSSRADRGSRRRARRASPNGPGWVDRALGDFRVLMLDQRGTGRSTPVGTLPGRSAQEQAEYLAHFRADSIVRDAEWIRRALGVERWSVLGQSFGGFCVTSYLSLAPDGLREAFITGGLPAARVAHRRGLRAHVRARARAQPPLLRALPERPRARPAAPRLVESGDVRLPSGDRLTWPRVRQLGQMLGMSDGAEQLHYVLELPPDSPAFLHDVEAAVLLRPQPDLRGAARGVLGRRRRDALVGASACSRPSTRRPELFTGEHVYPWMFEDYGALAPLREAAELLAEREWPRLYDAGRPRAATRCRWPRRSTSTTCTSSARSPRRRRRGSAALRTWITNEYEHNGLRADGERILGRLIDLARGRA